MPGYSEDILSDLEKTSIDSIKEPLAVLYKIKEYDFGDLYYEQIEDKYNPDYYEYRSFINKLYGSYLPAALEAVRKNVEKEDYELRGEIRDFALTLGDSSVTKYKILSELGDSDSFGILLKESIRVLQTETDLAVNPLPLLTLMTYCEKEKYDGILHEFIKNSYTYAKLHASMVRQYDYLKDNLNGDIFLMITQAIVSLPENLRNRYFDIFQEAYAYASSEGRSYSTSQVSGYMAIYATAFRKKISSRLLRSAIQITGKHYDENRFVHQTRYAKWYIEKNCTEALKYFRSTENVDLAGYIAALFADLNCKESIPVIEGRLQSLEDPVIKELFLEAISRLNDQKEAPRQEDRMVWMMEMVSPSQRALGVDSGNVFLKRARKKTLVDSTVYETDEE